MKTKILFSILLLLTPVRTAFAGNSEEEVLLRAYIRFSLAREVHGQALELSKEVDEAKAQQIRAIAEEWLEAEVETLRDDLDQRFGDAARERFASFVSEFTSAEKAGDPEYLDRLSTQVGLREPPTDYRVLRSLALERWLANPLSGSTRLLSEMQTWADVSARSPGTPSLDAWLERQGPPATPPPPQPSRPVNPLAAAEAKAPEFKSPPAASGSALDSFAQRRRTRREQAMQAAQAGMQQMALERQAAEQERAARISADAQADADAMRAQAQKLAAAEADAMAQRENSWGNRIKRIVGGTLSAGIGAFTGGVGSEAGRRAANEVFR